MLRQAQDTPPTKITWVLLVKGKINSNGLELLELSNRNNLTLTNTLFQHRLSHTTTWEAPFRNYTHWDATPEKKSYPQPDRLYHSKT